MAFQNRKPIWKLNYSGPVLRPLCCHGNREPFQLGRRACHSRSEVRQGDGIDQFHKSQNAPVPYPTMLHSEQKCAHFCSEWRIMGYGTGAFWDLWLWMNCSISHNTPFRTEMCTFLFWMEGCGIWNRCILGFVNEVNCWGRSCTQ